MSFTTVSVPAGSSCGQVAEDPVAHLPGRPGIDEKPRFVPLFGGMLGNQLLRQLVVELACVHPTATLPSLGMDDRYSLPPDIAAALERARLQVEALAQTADELQVVLPDAVGSALRDGLREEAAPISRRLAEVKGLTNQMIRRLERLETDMLAERHARIDDLALLVDLITGQWRSMNERLDRIEQMVEPRAQVVELRRPADTG